MTECHTEKNFNSAMTNISTKTYSKTFRDLVLKYLPGLGANESYWRLFDLLTFPLPREESLGASYVPRQLLASFEGKYEEVLRENYCAEDFLKAFSKDVFQITWTDWSRRYHRSRLIKGIVFPEILAEAIKNERDGVWKDDMRVFRYDGKQATQSARFRRREALRQEANKLIHGAHNYVAHGLLRYMNNLSPRTTEALKKYMEDAKRVARKLPKDVEHQLNALQVYEDDGLQLYKPVSNSSRIYPFGDGSLCSLHSDVRHALTKGLLEIDIVSAQLAIAASLWKLPLVTAFLQQPDAIFWQYLADYMDIDKITNKSVLKTALYAIMYGGKDPLIRTILSDLPDDVATSKHFERFISHPLIAEILRERGKQLDKISRKKGARDCFGRWIAVKKATRTDRKVTRRSVLAQLAQAMELKLLEEIISLAIDEGRKTDPKFVIVCFQHDGLTISIREEKMKRHWIRRFQKIFQESAAKLSVETTLKFLEL